MFIVHSMKGNCDESKRQKCWAMSKINLLLYNHTSAGNVLRPYIEVEQYCCEKSILYSEKVVRPFLWIQHLSYRDRCSITFYSIMQSWITQLVVVRPRWIFNYKGEIDIRQTAKLLKEYYGMNVLVERSWSNVPFQNMDLIVIASVFLPEWSDNPP